MYLSSHNVIRISLLNYIYTVNVTLLPEQENDTFNLKLRLVLLFYIFIHICAIYIC